MAVKKKTTRHIFVTGGVVSSLGKGLTAASLGMLLTARGLNVVMQKLDPYLNVDPGSMDPFQHGEVFVTADGGVCDLDVGHYERFLNRDLPKGSNVTTGQVYSNVIARERAGGYNGATVQVIPHITDEISDKIIAMGGDDIDVVITEIGGTIGDIEGLPFLEAARQVRQIVGYKNTFFLHISLIPFIGPARELKTKPTQHSVAALRQAGISPNAIVLRSDRILSKSLKEKVAFMCDVPNDGVVSCPDASSIYDIPKVLHAEQLDAFVISTLKLKFKDVDWTEWDQLLKKVHNPKKYIRIAVVGEHVELPDAYLSVLEALKAAGFANDIEVQLKWVRAGDIGKNGGAKTSLCNVQGVLLPSGCSEKGSEGQIKALAWARKKNLPALAIGGGAASLITEFSRNVASKKSDEDVEDFRKVIVDGFAKSKPAGERVMHITDGLNLSEAYGTPSINERTFRDFDVDRDSIEPLIDAGLAVAAVCENHSHVEAVEVPENDFHVGVLFHPEFKSRPTQPHPLFEGFVMASLKFIEDIQDARVERKQAEKTEREAAKEAVVDTHTEDVTDS